MEIPLTIIILPYIFDTFIVLSLCYFYYFYTILNSLKLTNQIRNFCLFDINTYIIINGLIYVIFQLSVVPFYYLINNGISNGKEIIYLRFREYWFILSFMFIIILFYMLNLTDIITKEFILKKSILYMVDNYKNMDYDKLYNLCKTNNLSIFPILQFKCMCQLLEKEDEFKYQGKQFLYDTVYDNIETIFIDFNKINKNYNSLKENVNENLKLL